MGCLTILKPQGGFGVELGGVQDGGSSWGSLAARELNKIKIPTRGECPSVVFGLGIFFPGAWELGFGLARVC